MRTKNIIYNLVFWIAFIYCAWLIGFVYAPDFSQIKIIWASSIAGMLALFFGSVKLNEFMQNVQEEGAVKELSDTIYKSEMAFFKKMLIVMSICSIIVFGLLCVFVNFGLSICFILGVIATSVAGYAGLAISTKAEAKTIKAAEESLKNSFNTARLGGLVSGFYLCGLAMFVLPVVYFIYKDPEIINGYALGSLFAAVFAAFGSGIFSKASNIIKSENSSVEQLKTVDNAGGNLNDILGTGADVFSSVALILVVNVLLGSLILNLIGAFLPLTLAATGIFCTILGSLFVRIKENGNISLSLKIGNFVSILLFAIISYYLVEIVFMPGYHGLLLSVLTGVVAGCLLCLTTKYFTQASLKPAKAVIENSKSDVSALASCVGLGTISTFVSMAIIAVSAIMSFILIGGMESYNGGAYGVALTALGMIVSISMIYSINAYGKIAKNALKMTETTGISEEAKQRIEKMVEAGKTTSASIKGVASGAAALAALATYVSFALTLNIPDVDILNPFVMFSVVMGASVPLLVYGISTKAVNCALKRTGAKMDSDESKDCVEYAKCITKSSLCGTILFILSSLLLPAVYGGVIFYMFGKEIGVLSIAAFLFGLIITGICLSILSANLGNVLDNIGKLTTKGATNSSINILIKFMPVLALALVGIFAA